MMKLETEIRNLKRDLNDYKKRLNRWSDDKELLEIEILALKITIAEKAKANQWLADRMAELTLFVSKCQGPELHQMETKALGRFVTQAEGELEDRSRQAKVETSAWRSQP